MYSPSPPPQSVPIDTLILHQEDFLVPVPWPSNAIRVDRRNCNQNPTVDPGPSSSDVSSSPPTSNSTQRTKRLHLAPRSFVWGEKVVRNALPCTMIPPWLDPVHVDIDDPTKLPLCWYGVPFYDHMIFEYARRIKVAVYMTYPNLGLKVGDLDAYGTWPKFVKWFEDQTGFTMHLRQVWGEQMPLLTFFTNHEMASIKEENWELIDVMLSEIGYPVECKLKWYLDRRLAY